MADVSAKKYFMCDQNSGVFFCYECQQALCMVCCQNHGKIPAICGHTITDISTIDISIVNKYSHCTTHEKEFLFYCVKCSDFICSKCATSTHYTHPFSEITDIVLKDREKATENILDLKLKIDAISNLQEKVKSNHLEQLQNKSKECVELIDSVCKELQSYIESKRDNKTTEIADNEKEKQHNFEAFLENADLVHKRYTHMLSELENHLTKKHGVTFHPCYRSIQSEIQALIGIPNEPRLAEVPSFTQKILYEEVIEYMKSKIENSTCKKCCEKEKTIKDLQLEYKSYTNNNQRKIKAKDDDNRRLTGVIQSLKDEKKVMQKKHEEKLDLKDLETNNLFRDFRKELDRKENELEKLSQKIKSSKEANMQLTTSPMQQFWNRTSQSSPMQPFWNRTQRYRFLKMKSVGMLENS